MEIKRFQKNNESFICLNCGKEVEKHSSSSRDHCTHCLWGLHVDINPGDRLNECRGLLKPIGMEIKNAKERIIYRCEKCLQLVKCIKAHDDDFDEILQLSSKIWIE